MKKVTCALLVSGLLAGFAAQAAEDGITRVPVLTRDQANVLLQKAEDTIKSHHIGGAVAIVDAAGQLITFDRLDGSTPANIALAPEKAKTSAYFGQPTDTYQQKIAQGNLNILGNPRILPFGGGIPIKLDGQVVGAIGVSTPNGDVDNEAAKAALTALK
ncbi:GlcG/HbpS family heme-binding protein [Rouxiella chamberiensis]|uniref:GlcG/HbpS family heme-binding protein n=1 Tax=Rouxiella chamberiensis TaxID=1513468 RepID=UPI0005D35A0B|nr:heme-binding protein [Rouxiella chamberiensis]